LEAKRYENLLGDPFINTQSDVARELGVTRARVSQVMGLFKLSPQIQKELLALQDQNIIRFFSERRLRPLLTIKDQSKQIREFNKMKEQIQKLLSGREIFPESIVIKERQSQSFPLLQYS